MKDQKDIIAEFTTEDLTPEEFELVDEVFAYINSDGKGYTKEFITPQHIKAFSHNLSYITGNQIGLEYSETGLRFFAWEMPNQNAENNLNLQLFGSKSTIVTIPGVSYTGAAQDQVSDDQNPTTGLYQYRISDEDYRLALSPKQNPTAFLLPIDSEALNKLDFSDGKLDFTPELKKYLKEHSFKDYEKLSKMDFPLLQQIFTAAVKTKISSTSATLTVSLPEFLHEMGMEYGNGKPNDILKKIRDFESVIGIMPDRGLIFRLLSVSVIDVKKGTMTIAVPFMMELTDRLDEKNTTQKLLKTGEEYTYIKPYYNKLLRSTITAERNKIAVELCATITTLLLIRGATPDSKTHRNKGKIFADPKKISYSISFRSLIEQTPLFQERLKVYSKTNYQNTALKRAFTKAYELLRTKTDAYEYFVDLKITEIVPTMTMLDKQFTAEFYGINGDYNQMNCQGEL